MPGPIHLLFGSRAAIEQYAAWRTENAPAPSIYAKYGASRPHDDGKMAPPEKHAYPDVWAGKRKKR